MNKLGWGGEGEGRRRRVRCMDPGKVLVYCSHCRYYNIYTHVVCSIHFMELWSVDLRICVTSITFASTFRISSHAQN